MLGNGGWQGTVAQCCLRGPLRPAMGFVCPGPFPSWTSACLLGPGEPSVVLPAG